MKRYINEQGNFYFKESEVIEAGYVLADDQYYPKCPNYAIHRIAFKSNTPEEDITALKVENGWIVVYKPGARIGGGFVSRPLLLSS